MTTTAVEIAAPADETVLSGEALDFVALLHRELNPTRLELLERRHERQARLDAGERPDFAAETEQLRQSEWQVAEAPPDHDCRGHANRRTNAQADLRVRPRNLARTPSLRS